MIRKTKKTLLVIFFIYLLYGLFLSQYNLNIIPRELKSSDPDGFYDYSGIFNVQTSNSTGSGSVEEVVQEAKLANVDFLVITDSNFFSRQGDATSYVDDVLVLDEDKFSYLDAKVVLMGRERQGDMQSFATAQSRLTDILYSNSQESQVAFSVLTHPFKENSQWHGDYPPGLNGLEVINLKAIWQNSWRNDKLSFFWSLLVYPFNPELALVRLFKTPSRELELWDELNKAHKTVAFAGTDAEARLKFIRSPQFQIPSYYSLFNIVRNHILLESELTGLAQKDIEKVMSALKSGQFYMSLDKMANPKGFNNVIRENDKVYPIGSEINYSDNLLLEVNLPAKPLVPFETVVFHNGKKVLVSNSTRTEYKIQQPGVYRTIVRVIPTFPLPDGKKWVTWIIANPFRVNPES